MILLAILVIVTCLITLLLIGIPWWVIGLGTVVAIIIFLVIMAIVRPNE